MKPYFIYVQRSDRTASDLSIELFASDAEACRAAASMLQGHPLRRQVEVWDGDRAIAAINRDEAAQGL